MNKYSSSSSYCYPGTDVLINHFGIQNQMELNQIEAGLTAKRLLDLQENPIRGNFDLEHLKNIHHYIFQDLYPFAGRIRTENIRKGSFSFANVQFIETAAVDLFKKLQQEKYLSNLSQQIFVERIAYYMAEINVLHPFREGNGRAQREFIRTLALCNGYEIDWGQVEKDLILQASIQSTTDYQPLAKVLEQCIVNH